MITFDWKFVILFVYYHLHAILPYGRVDSWLTRDRHGSVCKKLSFHLQTNILKGCVEIKRALILHD